ncbi:MAG: single-stranded-DNA-specific exonuclease RecJ [Planctomycetota bacterium]
MPDARKRRRWTTRSSAQTSTSAPDWADELGLHPVAARLLAQRGAASAEQARRFLEPRLSDLQSPDRLPGCADAARRLVAAVHQHRPIVIYGDYDVDGVTASAILHHALGALGGRTDIYIPHRVEEGYGLNADAVRAIAKTSNPDKPTLVVTVDCGVASQEPARIAKDAGLELVITDHHRFDPDRLPPADQIVHPGLGPEGEPPDAPCGAGVAFKLAWQTLREAHGSPDSLPDRLRTLLVELVSLAALGTIADIVPLVGENRVLAAMGLCRMRTTTLPGLRALMEASKLLGETVDAQHVGFVLGPRLNAMGRMGHAGEAAELLARAEGDRARQLAEGLSRVNNQRRKEEKRVLSEALAQVEETAAADDDHRAMLLAGEGWHPGVVGVVASRLVDRFHKPAVVLSIDPETGAAKGSGRSIDGFDLFAALEPSRPLMQRFGGHAMAVGMTVGVDQLDAVRNALRQQAVEILGEEERLPELPIDLDLDLAQCDVVLADQLARLAPFGRANPAPTLRLRSAVIAQPPKRMGKTGSHLSLVLRSDEDGRVIRAVGFGWGDAADELREGARVRAVGSLHINEWRGLRSAEFHIQDLRPVRDSDEPDERATPSHAPADASAVEAPAAL